MSTETGTKTADKGQRQMPGGGCVNQGRGETRVRFKPEEGFVAEGETMTGVTSQQKQPIVAAKGRAPQIPSAHVQVVAVTFDWRARRTQIQTDVHGHRARSGRVGRLP